jgi:hypothetical protein
MNEANGIRFYGQLQFGKKFFLKMAGIMTGPFCATQIIGQA